jgi:hypothetical protein
VLAPLKASLVGEILVEEIVDYLDLFMDSTTVGQTAS